MGVTDWGSLVDESRKVPIWEGDFELADEINTFWWQTWDTGRMDVGLRANISTVKIRRMGWKSDEDVERAVTKPQGALVAGMVGSLVAPALESAAADWSVEVKMPEVVEKETASGRPFWVSGGKVVVRCSVAKELELLINAVNRFALDSGWDGKTGRERWATRKR
jgi:hypothetical protein